MLVCFLPFLNIIYVVHMTPAAHPVAPGWAIGALGAVEYSDQNL